jgi:transcriptional regulator with XRE-family HTH domain
MVSQTILRELGSRIRTQRHEHGFTQEQLGEKASLHRTYIADIERGARNVSLINLCTIATAFNMSVSELLAGINTRLKGEQKAPR